MEIIFTSTTPHAHTHCTYLGIKLDCPSQPTSNNKQSQDQGFQIGTLYLPLCEALNGCSTLLESEQMQFLSIQQVIQVCKL